MKTWIDYLRLAVSCQARVPRRNQDGDSDAYGASHIAIRTKADYFTHNGLDVQLVCPIGLSNWSFQMVCPLVCRIGLPTGLSNCSAHWYVQLVSALVCPIGLRAGLSNWSANLSVQLLCPLARPMVCPPVCQFVCHMVWPLVCALVCLREIG